MATLRAVTSLHSRGQTSRVITGQHELLTATSWVLMGQHVRKNSCAPLTPTLFAPPHTRARARAVLRPLLSLRGPVAVVSRLKDVVGVRGGAR